MKVGITFLCLLALMENSYAWSIDGNAFDVSRDRFHPEMRVYTGGRISIPADACVGHALEVLVAVPGCIYNTKTKVCKFSVSVSREGRDWLFLNMAEMIVMGKIRPMQVLLAPDRRTTEGGGTKEILTLKISEQLLKSLATFDSAVVASDTAIVLRVEGDRGCREAGFGREMFDHLQWFYKKVCEIRANPDADRLQTPRQEGRALMKSIDIRH